MQADSEKARRAPKGARTRARILEEAAAMASLGGFSGVTLGGLAERLGLSKSGMFGHFGSKDALEAEILDQVAARFGEIVLNPQEDDSADPQAAFAAMVGRWMDWTEGSVYPGGCPMFSAQSDYDDRPGAQRDRVVRHFRGLRLVLLRRLRAAVPGLSRDAAEQAAFELEGVMQAFARNHRLMRDPKARLRAETAVHSLLARLQPGAAG